MDNFQITARQMSFRDIRRSNQSLLPHDRIALSTGARRKAGKFENVIIKQLADWPPEDMFRADIGAGPVNVSMPNCRHEVSLLKKLSLALSLRRRRFRSAAFCSGSADLQRRLWLQTRRQIVS
jgi:hypothetical protein